MVSGQVLPATVNFPRGCGRSLGLIHAATSSLQFFSNSSQCWPRVPLPTTSSPPAHAPKVPIARFCAMPFFSSGPIAATGLVCRVRNSYQSLAISELGIAQPRRRPASVAEIFRAWMLETPEKRRNGPRIFAPEIPVFCSATPTDSGLTSHGSLGDQTNVAARHWTCPDVLDESLRVDEEKRVTDMTAEMIAAPP